MEYPQQSCPGAVVSNQEPSVSPVPLNLSISIKTYRNLGLQSPKIGGTYKVSTEMLTPFLLPSVLTVSGFVSLAYEPITAVSPTWLFQGCLVFTQTTGRDTGELNP